MMPTANPRSLYGLVHREECIDINDTQGHPAVDSLPLQLSASLVDSRISDQEIRTTNSQYSSGRGSYFARASSFSVWKHVSTQI